MSEDEYGPRRGSLPEGYHRQRPGHARWWRAVTGIACVVAGVVMVVRGVIEGDALWLWIGAGLIVLGIGGVLLVLWMFRRRL